MRRAAVALLALLGACAHEDRRWIAAEPVVSVPGGGFDLAPPAGWMRLAGAKEGPVLLTRDGTALQEILAGSCPVGQPLGLWGSKRIVSAEVSLLETEELLVDAMRSRSDIREATVVESAAAELGGQRAFRTVVAFRDDDGLAMRAEALGTFRGRRLYWLFYLAPERHYFALDRAVFEEVARSFRPRPGAGP